jgi:aldehyde:ferredoxin oxidoreductase
MESLEYEPAWSVGANVGNNDANTVAKMIDLCNDYGVDAIEIGHPLSIWMEATEKGWTNGDGQLKWGDIYGMTDTVKKIAMREGIGNIMAEGANAIAAHFGHPELAMTCKGQGIPAYDPRGMKGMGLAYATSNRGACHLRGYTVASEVLGIPIKTDPLVAEGKPELVMAFQDATAAFDSAGICIFTSFAWGLADVAPQVAAACGPEFTLENLSLIGERIWNMERDFNNRAGFTAKDDNLPPRLLNEAAKTGPAKGLTSKLPEMLPKYYQVRGWNADGTLTAATRAKLGL